MRFISRNLSIFLFACVISVSGLLSAVPVTPEKNIHSNQTTEQKKTICLNMIVKDESKIITRCLESALPIIDTWVIVDTGSTDGTQDIIRNYMKEKGVPGTLYERPWKNFAYNRNEAIELAKGCADFLIFIDADEFFKLEPGFKLPPMDKDYYYATILFDNTLKYDRIQIVNNHLDWKYYGALHEVLIPPPDSTTDTFQNFTIVSSHEGARSSDPEKFQKDARILEEAYKEDPTSTRTVFYLAQSYAATGDQKKAIEWYEKRVSMGGWDQEVYCSLLRIARLKEFSKEPKNEVIKAYQQAFSYRPRAEPIYYLSCYLRHQNDHHAAYKVSQLGKTLIPSKDILFVEFWMYEYGLALEHSVNAYWVGKYKESQNLSLKILEKNDIPDDIRHLVQKNLEFTNQKLLESLLDEPAPIKAHASLH